MLDVRRRRECCRDGKGCKDQNRTQHRGLLSLAALCLSAAVAATAADLPRPLGPADFLPFDADKAAVGRLLFYDKILSGNRDIACATCHHHDLGTGDGLPLGIGAGGHGLGPERSAGAGRERIARRVARNAPGLWNLGWAGLERLFWDGRLEASPAHPGGFNAPAGDFMPHGLPDLVAAQALFPMVAEVEMAGPPDSNPVAGAAQTRIDTAWPIIAARVRAIPGYAARVSAAFAVAPQDISIREIATALSHFVRSEWQSHDSAFDAFLAGDAGALAPSQRRGLDLFYGKARCSTCHSGPMLSDQGFHALALPAFGPGRTRPFDPYARDVGRMGESDDVADAYRFRTPMLRNVALTAPYGHNGAYATLEDILRHHLDPLAALAAWRPGDVALPAAPWLAATDFVVLQDRFEQARLRARIDIEPLRLSDGDLADLVAFLHGLTGTASVTGRLGKPDAVPSGLPVD